MPPSPLDKLERRFGRFHLEGLALYIVIGQVFLYLIGRLRPDIVSQVWLVPSLVLDGEPWRLVTFVFTPPADNLFFAAITLYLFWLMGSALEREWGAFRFNLYLLIAWGATVGAAFFYPELPATNAFLLSSVWLAFAFMFPNFELYVFFILPVKVKWLALLTWLGYAYVVVVGPGPSRVMVLAATCNFFVFFGRELVLWAKNRQRAAVARARWEANKGPEAAPGAEPFHRCAECGLTDLDDPKMTFRYCDACEGHYGFCEAHVHNHAHRRAAAADHDGDAAPAG